MRRQNELQTLVQGANDQAGITRLYEFTSHDALWFARNYARSVSHTLGLREELVSEAPALVDKAFQQSLEWCRQARNYMSCYKWKIRQRIIDHLRRISRHWQNRVVAQEMRRAGVDLGWGDEEGAVDLYVDTEAPTPLEAVIRSEVDQILERAIQYSLFPRQSQVIQYLLQGYEVAEISQVLRIAQPTVRNIKRQAIARLRGHIPNNLLPLG